MKRRAFLAGVTGVMAGGSALFGNATPLKSKTVEVSVIIGEDVRDGPLDFESAEISEICYSAIENACQTIPDNKQEIVIDRKADNGFTVDLASASGINNYEYKTHNSRNLVKEMETVIDGVISDEHTANDSNVILTHADMGENRGIGTMPVTCLGIKGARTAVVTIPRHYNDELHIPDNAWESSNRVLASVIHEFGHNVGLDHKMGVIEKETDSTVVVTPMLSSYACRDSNERSSNLPKADECYAKDVYYKTQFNSDIELSDILNFSRCHPI